MLVTSLTKVTLRILALTLKSVRTSPAPLAHGTGHPRAILLLAYFLVVSLLFSGGHHVTAGQPAVFAVIFEYSEYFLITSVHTVVVSGGGLVIGDTG